MSTGRQWAWLIVGLAVILPMNWFRVYFIEPHTASDLQGLIIASLISLSIAVALSFFLVKSAKGLKILREKRAMMLEKLAALPLNPVRPSQTLLKPGEVAYGVIGATLKEVQTVGYAGRNTGVSVRIAKGIRVNSGGSRSHAVKDFVSVASGELVITNQRVVFAGDHKSFAIALPHLINVTNYSDGIGFHDEHKSYVLVHGEGLDIDAFAITVQKVLDQRSATSIESQRAVS
jgi:hypothetical protein